MIYSYKEVVHLEPPVTTDTFDTSHAYNAMRSNVGGEVSAEKEMELRSAICTLGEFEGRYYISIPDGVDIGPQNPACDVRKESALSEAQKVALRKNLDHFKMMNELASRESIEHQEHLSYYESKNIANLYTLIRDLNSVLAKMIEASPTLMSADSDPNFSASLETIKELKAKSDELNKQASKLGL